MGQHPCTLPKERERSPHQPHRKRSLHQLATAKQMHLNHPRLQARMLRLWQTNSQSSEVPSSAEGLTLALHTTQRRGAGFSAQQGCRTSIQPSLIASSSVLTLASDPSHTRSLPPTIQLLTNTAPSSMNWFKSNYKRGATSAQSHMRKSNPCWVPFRLPPLASLRSQGGQANTGSYKTSLPPIPLST